jgi:uncharacterized protein (DUF2141 family)
MVPPGGGLRDTLPPRLIVATPKDSALNVTTDRITLNFDEYIEVRDVQQNLIVSPNPVQSPIITPRARAVSIRLRDSLLPNTTYSINFGNSIKDVNEGNVLKNFTYVFSTGNRIDENTITGKILLAESGKLDTTLIVVLHRNLNDSAIRTLRPLYYAKQDGQGNFAFQNLPAGRFAMYVVEDDYAKKYDDSTELFAFADTPVLASLTPQSVSLFAFRAAQKNQKPVGFTGTRNTNKKLTYSTNLTGRTKEQITPLTLTFSTPLRSFDSNSIQLTDTNFTNRVRPVFSLDTSRTVLSLSYPWKENTHFKLVIPATSVTDTSGTSLSKSDTLNFTTDAELQYGSLRLRFSNIDTSKHQVVQLYQNDKLVESIPVNSNPQWFRRLYRPGQYQVRILIDRNNNGVWDTGDFTRKKQPEIVIDRKLTLNIRSNWDNDEVIAL